MRAFNRRFEPRQIFGVPLPAMLGGAVCGVSATLAFMLPGIWSLSCVLAAIAGAAFAAVALRYHEHLVFVRVAIIDWRERRLPMRETWSSAP